MARIFATIAVSKPEDLTALPGAITGARRIGEWARQHGYEVIAIDDSGVKEVTVSRIRQALETTINQVTSTQVLDRIVVYFAGHGLATDANTSFWLLSNWKTNSNEAVKVPAFQRVLRFYHPTQVAIISDACRTVGIDSLDIIGSAVLERPDEDPHDFELDRFFAVDAGEQSFMVRADGTDDAYCLFTEVLLDALEGDASAPRKPGEMGPMTVTSQSLAKYLRESVPRAAGQHNVSMQTDASPGFFTDCIYAEIERLVSDVVAPSPASETHVVTYVSDTFSAPSVDTAQPANWGREHDLAFFPAPIPRRATLKAALQPVDRKAASDEVGALSRDRARRQLKAEQVVHAWRDAQAPTHFETGIGLSVHGATPDSVAPLNGGHIEEDRPGTWYRVVPTAPNQGFADLVVSFASGFSACVCTLHEFIATLALDASGWASVVYRPIYLGATSHDAVVLDVIAKMNAGVLSREEVASVAAQIRVMKHLDPSLGCVAAYLYDSIGDIEAVRKTASYYPKYGQLIPLDIAILSGGRIARGGDGSLRVDIPATETRRPTTQVETQHDFTWAETPACEGALVGGLVPWMRGGWFAVETAFVDDTAKEWRDGIRRLASALGPSPFSMIQTSSLPELVPLVRTHNT